MQALLNSSMFVMLSVMFNLILKVNISLSFSLEHADFEGIRENKVY